MDNIVMYPHDDITPAMSRQEFRAMGMIETRRRLKTMFPSYTRHQIRDLARELHHKAWAERDTELVAKIRRGGIIRKDGGGTVAKKLAAQSSTIVNTRSTK